MSKAWLRYAPTEGATQPPVNRSLSDCEAIVSKGVERTPGFDTLQQMELLSHRTAIAREAPGPSKLHSRLNLRGTIHILKKLHPALVKSILFCL